MNMSDPSANTIINSLNISSDIPPNNYPTEYTCMICLDTMQNISLFCESECLHTFHTDCIKQWLSHGHNNCPVCKSPSISVQPIKFRTEEEYVKIQRMRESKLKLTQSVSHLLRLEHNTYIDSLSLEDLNGEIFISLRSAGDYFYSSQAYEYHINYHMRLEERVAEIESIERETDYLFNMHMGVRQQDYTFLPQSHSLTRLELERIFTPVRLIHDNL